jgi:hypothetical protein
VGLGGTSTPDLRSLFEQYDELAENVVRSKHQFFQGNLQRRLEFLNATAPFAKPILQQLEGPVDFNVWFQPYTFGADFGVLARTARVSIAPIANSAQSIF